MKVHSYLDKVTFLILIYFNQTYFTVLLDMIITDSQTKVSC